MCDQNDDICQDVYVEKLFLALALGPDQFTLSTERV